MPLQVLSKFGLPEAIVRVSEPSFIFSETCNLEPGITMLLTYRSPVVKDGSPLYEHVKALLDRHASELIYEGVVDDEGMMFGEGRWETRLLYPMGQVNNPTNPTVIGIIDVLRNWGSPMHPTLVVEEATRRLASIPVM